MRTESFLRIIQRNIIGWILIPTVVFTVGMGCLTFYYRVADFKNMSSVLARATGRFVSNYLRDGFEALGGIAARVTPSDTDKLTSELEMFQNLNTHFERLFWLDSHKRVKSAYPSGVIGVDFPLLFKKVSGKNYLLSRPMQSLETGRIVIYLGHVTQFGEMLVGELSLKILGDNVRDMLPEYYSIILMDRYGNVIVHPDEALVRQQGNVGDLEILKTKESFEIWGAVYNDGEQWRMGATSMVQGVGMTMLISQPLTAMLNPALQMTGILTVMIVFSLLFLILNFRKSLSRILLEPLNNFLSKINDVARGDYVYEAAPSSKFLELATVEKEFGIMSREIRRREEDLENSRHKLEESEVRYRSIFNNASEGIFQSTVEGRFITVNPAMAKFLGFKSPNEVVEAYQDLATQLYFNPAERKAFLSIVRKEGRASNFETQFKKRNGEPVWVSINVHAVGGKGGEIEYMEGTVNDITERKAAEEELKINLEKYKVLFESFPLGLSVISEDGSILEVNQESERLLGITSNNHTSRDLDSSEWNIVGPDGSDLDPEELPAAKALADNRVVRNEEIGVLRPDGGRSWISVTAAPIPLEGYGVVVGYNDVTDRKQAEDKLLEAKEMLEEKVRQRTEQVTSVNLALKEEIKEHERTEEAINVALKEKEVLLKEIHHRVKNNMAVVTSLLSLQMSRVDDALVKEALQDTSSRVKSMALIHENLYQSESLAKISIRSYTKNLVSTLAHAMSRGGADVRITVDAEDIDLTIDQAVPFGLIINELVTNALKYAFADGRSGVIEISARLIGENMIELKTRDNGVGLPEGLDLKNVDSLGLKIISLLIENQLDGSWEVSNNEGALFTMRWELPET